MASTKPRHLLRIEYEDAAEAYLRSLPLEHFMEATAQATQRKITLESLDLVHADRPDFQLFNELLVQYPLKRGARIGQVVPDNMVVLWHEPIKASGSYDLPLQPTGPFWVLEYVSKASKRKDYDDSFKKYEEHLRVPYYLLFYPDGQELTLYRHTGKKYVSVKPQKNGRHALANVEIEVAILNEWVRFWYRGELLPLPADLQRSLMEAQQRLEAETKRADELEQRLAAALRQLEEERKRGRGTAKP
jgi:Uma2 family endonuclease